MKRTNYLVAAVGVAAAVCAAPIAHADEPDVYGLITSDEREEISTNGWQSCETLRDIAVTREVTSEDARALVEGYLTDGWDLESAGDIVWESVETDCAEYVPLVEAAMQTYPPMY